MLRILAHILSIAFHPIFILPLLFLYTYASCRHLFIFSDARGFELFVIYSIVTGVILPMVAVAMMRGLGLISSWQIENRQERIGPLLVTGLFYIWLFYNYYKNPDIPKPILSVTLGASISLFVAFFLNNFSKISIHAVGVGGLVVGSIFISFIWSYNVVHLTESLQIHAILFIAIIVIICGSVLTSRLLLEAHTLQQIYHGFLVGCIGQIIALNIIL